MRFDTANEKEDSGFEPIPPGIYRVMVGDALLKPNKSGNGQHVSMKMTIVDGQHKKRMLWHNFNVENANANAQKIGRGQMKSFLTAIGITKSIDLATELPSAARDKVVHVEVVNETSKDGQIRDVVKKFANSADQGGSAPVTSKATYAPAQPAEDGSVNVNDIPF